MDTMTAPTRRELKSHQGRSATTIHGWPSVLFGLPFFGVGVGALVVWRVAPQQVEGPTPLLLWFGAVFGLVGFSLILHGVKGLRLRARVAERKRAHPNEPWQWDHPWDPYGARDDSARRVRKGFFGAAFIVVFMIPFNYVGFVLEGVAGRLLWMGIVGLFDVIAVVVAGYAVYLLLRYLKYGTSAVSFETFPFRLGERAGLRFLGPGRSELLEPVSVTLRAVEEAYETRGSGKNRSQRVVCYETYVDTQAIDDVRRRWEGRRGLELAFELPSEAAGTRMSERPPRYWELEITADVPGVDYKAVFLLPVY
jgi:hypothetical protein